MTAEEQSYTTTAQAQTADALREGITWRGTAEELKSSAVHVAVLTGGGDKPYALGLASALVTQGIESDFIGSDEVDAPELRGSPLIHFLNLRGDNSANANYLKKVLRVLTYYLRILGYAVSARPKIFHLLWHNKFLFFDRTVVMGLYKLLGKRVVFTAHNVNAGKRDGTDTVWNRISLRSQYRLADHIFVHTEMMKKELISEFGVPDSKVTVIPFGINNTLPNSPLTPAEARQRLGIGPRDKTVLFFGNIAPYKGVEYLAAAMARLVRQDPSYRMVIAGRPKGCEAYWEEIHNGLERAGIRDRVIEKIAFIPDAEVEVYFKAADLLVLPYTLIFQSGVLFLGYSFGLPVLAADVGSLKEEIVEGQTGLVCQPCDPGDLAKKIQLYFAGELYRDLEQRRPEIRRFANERYSWTRVGEITKTVYARLLNHPAPDRRGASPSISAMNQCAQPQLPSSPAATPLRAEQATHGCFGLLSRRERWGLSRRGWLLAVAVALVAASGFLFGAHPFLAVSQRTDTGVLVVEGWVHEYALRVAAAEFQSGRYQRAFTTGGPTPGAGGYVNDWQTSASVGAAGLKKAGVPEKFVQMVPSRVLSRDRTYSSAIALRDWFLQQNQSVRAINVMTEDAHARRTRLLFQKAFGKEVAVGIISVPNPDYDAKHWWRYSEGVREILGESIAYLYARFLFHPSDSVSKNPPAPSAGNVKSPLASGFAYR